MTDRTFIWAAEACYAISGILTGVILQVSRAAGEPWRDRLLRLPPFLREAEEGEVCTADDLRDGFALTGRFLLRHVLLQLNQLIQLQPHRFKLTDG